MNSKLAGVSSQLKAVKIADSKSSNDLKPWHYAVLIGVPSAAILAFFLYKKYYAKSGHPDSSVPKDVKTKSEFVSNVPVASSKQQQDATPKRPKTELEKAVEKKNQGNECFQAGRFEDAVKCYSEAIDLCPKQDKEELPKFYQNRAAAYENLKMYEKVIEDCTNALAIDHNYEKALTRRAKAYENLGKLQEAFEDLTSLCILQRFSSTSMVAADKMVKKIGEKMSADIFKNRKGLPISQHFVNNFFVGLNNDIIFRNSKFYDLVKEQESSVMRQAIDEFNAGRFDECIRLCTQEIDESKPYAMEARNLRGSLHMLRCQYTEALQDFKAILDDPNPSSLSSCCYQHNDELDESDAEKTQDFNNKRLKSNTFIKMTALNLQNSKEDEAFENYSRAIQIDPTNEDIYCNRAQVYAMKNRFEESFKDFDKVLELNSEHKIARLQKAFFQFRQFYAQLAMFAQATQQPALLNESRELKEETTKLEKLLTELSDVPEAFSLYAQILSEQEKYEKAEEYYRMALEKDANNGALIVQRALNIMTWKNEFDEAVKMLNQAIEIDNTCEFAYETLATIEIQRGNLPRAVELFERAIELTRNEESMTNLCCMLVGAKTQFKVLNHLSQNNPANNLDLLNTIARNGSFN